MKFVLSVNINDDDGVPTCEELGVIVSRAGEQISKEATLNGYAYRATARRVTDCGESGRILTPDGRHVGDWRIE